MKDTRQSNAPDPRLGTLHHVVSSIFSFFLSLSFPSVVSILGMPVHTMESRISPRLFLVFFLFPLCSSHCVPLSRHLQIHWFFSFACSNLLLGLSSEFFILVTVMFLISKFTFGSFSYFLSLY